MKKFYQLSIIIFSFAFILVTSCKKDPCEQINCQNEGFCELGTCICPKGFGGSNCEQENIIPNDSSTIDFSCINVIELGADNTGQEDCWQIIQTAINQGQNLCFPAGVYKINQGLIFNKDSSNYQFDNAILTSPNRITLINIQGENITLDGMTIDMFDSPVNREAIKIDKPSKNIKIINCIIRNIKDTSGARNLRGLQISLDGIQEFVIENCRFENINLVNDGDIEEANFVTGISLSDAQIITESTGKIIDCHFENIFNTKIGSDTKIDSDGIYFYSEENLQTPISSSGIEILRCQFFNCQKRALKVSGTINLSIRDINIFNNRDDHYQHEAIRIHNSENIEIKNIFIFGNIIRGVSIGLNSRDINIQDLYYKREASYTQGVNSSYAIHISRDSLEGQTTFLENISCKNIEVKNAKACIIEKSNNIDINSVIINRIDINPLFDTDYEDNNNTFLDNIVEIKRSTNVKLKNIELLDPSPNTATALRIEDSQYIDIEDSWFKGWGKSVLEVIETEENDCSDILFLNGGVEQVGYLESSANDSKTVLFRSNNTGILDGITNLNIQDWEIKCTQFPTNFGNNNIIALFETPNANVNGLKIKYESETNCNFNSLLFLSRIDNSIFENIFLESLCSSRSIYMIESINANLNNFNICVPDSQMDVELSNNIQFGDFYILDDFSQDINDSNGNVPVYHIIASECN